MLHDMPTVHLFEEEKEKHPRNIWYEKSKESADQDQEQAATEHGIVYFKQDGDIQVKDTPIDVPKARMEMESLGCGKYNHFIGFRNLKTREYIQFVRREPNLWYADVPIQDRHDWEGYVWGCNAGLAAVLNTVELFINENPWFDTLPFTMRNIGKEALADALARSSKKKP